MGLENRIQRIKESWDKGYGEGSELLITIISITLLWILITHTV